MAIGPTIERRKYLIPIEVAGSGPVALASEYDDEITVHAFTLSAQGTVTVKWENGSTDLTGAVAMTTNSPPWSMGPSEEGLFQATGGNNLVLTLSAGITVGGFAIVSVQGNTRAI